MNGIENITNRILSDARAEADKIIAEAEARAKQIEAEALSRADDACAQIKEKGARNADDRVVRLQGVASLEARKMLLKTKQQMIDIAFKSALNKLASSEDYAGLLATLASRASISGNEQVILSADDREKYGKSVVSLANKQLSEGFLDSAGKLIRGEGLKLSDEVRAISGGVILKEGTLEVDASLETLISSLRDTLAVDVANILFG